MNIYDWVIVSVVKQFCKNNTLNQVNQIFYHGISHDLQGSYVLCDV